MPHERPRRTKDALLASVKTPIQESKFLARNTVEYWPIGTGERIIRLHDTDLLTFGSTGTIGIETGGFNTETTRARLNTFLPEPWGVFTTNGQLSLHNRTTGKDFPFDRSATILPNGSVRTDAESDPETLASHWHDVAPSLKEPKADVKAQA